MRVWRAAMAGAILVLAWASPAEASQPLVLKGAGVMVVESPYGTCEFDARVTGIYEGGTSYDFEASVTKRTNACDTPGGRPFSGLRYECTGDWTAESGGGCMAMCGSPFCNPPQPANCVGDDPYYFFLGPAPEIVNPSVFFLIRECGDLARGLSGPVQLLRI